MAITNRVRIGVIAASFGIALAALAVPSTANAATTIDGPINLGSAAPFGVLAGSKIANTGPTTDSGDLGLSPGTAITGFPPGIVGGTTYAAEEVAEQAKVDLTTAYNTAASLTPTTQGLGDLAGLSLTPGVYSGGALSLNGTLTLAGSASSVWVFQAASTLVTGTDSSIVLTGGATACNVFWKVGSSATLGTGTDFVGTVMAQESITAVTGATIQGRLLASTSAVTLDTNVITVPTGCDDTGTVVTDSDSPEITSGTPSDGTVDTPYTFTVEASGTPTPTYTITDGDLPAGLTIDTTTGVISGTPTTPGTFTFTVTASNGVGQPTNAIYSVGITPAAVVTPPVTTPPVTTPPVAAPPVAGPPASGATTTLANTGADITPLVAGGALALLLGTALILQRRFRSARASGPSAR